MTGLTHIFITRFSYRGTEWHSGQDPLDPQRLARRLELFQVTALPTILGQTHRDFVWLLIVDPALPAAILRALRDLTAPHPRVHVHRYSPGDDLGAGDWLRPCLRGDEQYVVTTLLDDDDLLFSGFAAAVRQWTHTVIARTPQPWLGLLGCGKALQWDYVASRAFPAGCTKPWHRQIDVPGAGSRAFPVSAGFTVLAKWPEVQQTVLGYEHLWAAFYFADEATLAGLRRLSDALVDHLILPKRQRLAAVAAAGGRAPEGTLLDPPFQYLPGDTVQAVMVNHSLNDQVLRLFEPPAARDGIADIDALQGFALDPAVARRHARPLSRSLPALLRLLRLAWTVEGKRGGGGRVGQLRRGARAAVRILSVYLGAPCGGGRAAGPAAASAAPARDPSAAVIARRPRPASVAAFRALLDEGRDREPAVPPGFTVRPGDVLIASYPKCGTTWVQQIVHGLRTGGSMDFEEISLVVPWIETAPLLGIDLNAPQVADPRAFKTHLPWGRLPPGGRNLFIVRDPGDALVSAYRFMSGVMFEPDAVDLAAFADAWFLRGRPGEGYWDQLRAWWPVRDRDDVLLLCYEDLQADLRGAVARIARFCGIAADDGLIDLATRQARFEFMRAHPAQFDDQPTLTAFMDLLGLPPARAAKVRAGRVGDGATALPPPVVEQLARRWREDLAEPLGLASYQALREALRAANQA